MRLTDFQTSRICSAAMRSFGEKTRVWLFGSRVNDQARGGDIDLYIEPEIQDAVNLVDAKLHFMVEMHRTLGDQKIDVVLHRTACEKVLPVCRIAKETGVRLQ